MNEVELSSENVEPPSWLPDLRDVTESVAREIGRPEWTVSVLLCDDDRIAELNRTYRKTDGPTDVLSFSPEPMDPQSISGDIAISLPTVNRNADEYGVSIKEEFLRVFVHALLHLAGYTHHGVDLSTAAADHPMLGLQERLIATLQKELDS
ncbi:MAG: rRNA maturation RNase YbeY [Spirochaetota bacterium]